MTQGRDLPPLLPLEYCRIDRAARMLQCEVDDIIHWAEIGAVELTVKLNAVSCALCMDNDLWDEIEELPDGFKSVDQNSFFGGFSYFKEASIHSGFREDKLNVDGLIQGFAYGFWGVDKSVSEILSIENKSDGCYAFGFTPVTPDVDLKYKVSLAGFDREGIELSNKNLWIMRSSLQKLHHSITTGEHLSNIYNNTELAQQAEKSARRNRAPRTSHPQSEMIRALLLLHPDITEDQLSTPHKLHGVLTEIFKATNGKIIMPDVHPNTFERWLKATANS